MKLLFISNLFPDAVESYRGLDNATLLHALSTRWEIRVLALRPSLPFRKKKWTPRAADSHFHPTYAAMPYVPKIGGNVNHLLARRVIEQETRMIRETFPFDALLGSWIYPDCCAIAPLARKEGWPFAAIAQGSDVHQYLQVPSRRRAISKCIPQAGAVITRSAELARLLAGAGVPEEMLHPVYNGIDHAIFQRGDRTAARKALELPEDAPILLFVGNLLSIKNPLLLIDALAEIRSRRGLHDAILGMIGGGPLQGDLEAHAASLGISSAVRFAGRQASTTVARYMQAADLLALPSQNEGVPNVILEAFACGLPVVASNVGGIAEVHTTGTLGKLVPPGDLTALSAALAETLSQKPDRAAIAEHGAQFTWENTADRCHQILLDIVRPTPTPSAT